MDIESIKQLIKNGDFPQAHNQLRQILSRTPDDAVAQMLYGTCCQIMGDSGTFGRIYQKLAPEMERCVKRGDRSERTAMWIKYAAMFAMIFTFGFQTGCVQEAFLSPGSDGLSSVEVSSSVTSRKGQEEKDESSLYQRVQNMSLKEKFRYFLQRQDVKDQLHKGALRAVVIPLQSPFQTSRWSQKADEEQENLLLIRIRTKNDLKTGADVVKTLKTHRDDSLVWFSPFEKNASSNNRAVNADESWRFACMNLPELAYEEAFYGRHYDIMGFKKAIQCIEEHGDLSDLILSSDESGGLILGICFVSARSMDYYNNTLDDDSFSLRRVVLPEGTVEYGLTKEMFRKKMEEGANRWARVLNMSLQKKFRYFLERQDVKEQLECGEMRVAVIPLQSPGEGRKQENLLLIRTKGPLKKNDTDALKALKAISNENHQRKRGFTTGILDDDEESNGIGATDKTRSNGKLFVVFSPFERNSWTDGGTAKTSGIWRFKEFRELEKMDFGLRQGVEKAIQCIAERGDMSDLIVTSDESGYLVLGVCFVNVHGSMARTVYGGPRDYGDRFPKYVMTPQGKMIYELTEEMVRKQMEEARKRWDAF